ncbi:histone-lysine N-methyltransferase family member SUVH9-like [Iris pallida]|uniref:Histone-lysine N-methyltransferase family member SUVH9-like n=1 Tax=Iris pallida TaxID=29817 RepID=A0AAX6DS54_IRIPA|nr:histone-lysine N-methyltransferase family member SUVH9-like [Iris pallida]
MLTLPGKDTNFALLFPERTQTSLSLLQFSAAMADPSPSSPVLDLNIVPYQFLSPKLELSPKPEPIELPNPNPNPNFIPEVHTPLQQLSPSSGGEDDLFAEYFRLAQIFLANYRSGGGGGGVGGGVGSGGAIMPTAGTSSAVVVSKKSRGRSGEMVRVSSLTPQDQSYFRDLIRRTRITFESLRLLVLRDEDRSGAAALGPLAAKRGRPDLKSAALMKNRDLWLNRDKRIIGSIPGINVGDIYFFRMEICVIGLHGQVQAGIDYVPASLSSSGEPVATSIIVSGGYEDDDDKGYELIYTGQGGQDRNAHKHCIDQKLQRGNLGLERSMAYGIEIRVIRGIKCDKSPTGKVYVYDGLYKIVDCWFDVGKSGFSVYKYKLLRIEGQEEMGSLMMKLAEELKVNPLSVRPKGYVTLDMSMGKEKVAVSLFNDIDDDRDPLLFEYLTCPAYPPRFREKIFGDHGGGCQCVRNCTVDCYCAKLNGGEFAYDGGGFLLRGKPVVYECGPFCRCPPSCPNRVSQKGVKNRLEVFRSLETGWGVRSLDLIRAGAFICEFSGVVLTKQQAEAISVNGEGFVCPNRFPGRWVEWGDISDVFPDYMPPSLPSLPGLDFSIDVSRARNVACYISHSYSPNVFVQFVLYDHYNVAFPHLMIFALENIPPLRELSIDYGMAEELVGKLTL